MITVREKHIQALPHAARNKGQIYLFHLTSPAIFAANLPLDFQPPTVRNPDTGLPPNIWVGVEVITEEDVRAAERLLDIRARIRWIEVGYVPLKVARGLADLFAAWRCSSCGHRGSGRRPKLCPHAKSLCGDAKIEPQIHWLRNPERTYCSKDYGSIWSGYLRGAAQEHGLVLEPNIPDVKL